MAGKKLDFLMHGHDGHQVAVKVRILKTHGFAYASFDGGVLQCWNAPIEQIDDMIEVLTAVRAEVSRGAYAKPT